MTLVQNENVFYVSVMPITWRLLLDAERSALPVQDLFGTEFFEHWEDWNTAGRPGYAPTGGAL